MGNMFSLDLLIVEGEVQLGVGRGGVILQRKVRGLLVKEREMDSGQAQTMGVHYTNRVNRCIKTRNKINSDRGICYEEHSCKRQCSREQNGPGCLVFRDILKVNGRKT